MPIDLGTKRVTGLWLGTREIQKIWLGTDLVYQTGSPTPAEVYTLFDNGWVSGVNWLGNYLPRPQYTSMGKYNFANVDQGGYMRLYIGNVNGQAVSYNCHVCTNGVITVPGDATVMKVMVSSAYGYTFQKQVYFGLLTPDCVNALDDTNGGQMSGHYSINTSTPTTLSLTLNAGIAGGQFVAVVNQRNNSVSDDSEGDGTNFIRIHKVWFE